MTAKNNITNSGLPNSVSKTIINNNSTIYKNLMNKIKVKFGKEELNIWVKKVSKLGRVTGLMFKSQESPNLLFEFSNSKIQAIHSYFVFFSFLAIWLDENNKVTDFTAVHPFTSLIKPKKPSKKL